MNGSDTEGETLLHQDQDHGPEPTDEHYRKAAHVIYSDFDHDFDTFPRPRIETTDRYGGAWVQAWVWVPEASARKAMKGNKEEQE